MSRQTQQLNELKKQMSTLVSKSLKTCQELIDRQTIKIINQNLQKITTVNSFIQPLQYFLNVLINQIEKANAQVSKSNSNESKKDYQNLESALQKAEGQIRKHIRLEQQLKIYMDGLEQRVEQLQKQLKNEKNKYIKLFQSVKLIDNQKKQLQRRMKINELKQIKGKTYHEKQYTGEREIKILSHKASKILTQPTAYENSHNIHISKIYNQRIRPVKTRNFRERSENKIIHSSKFEEIQTQKKGLQSEIYINLSYNNNSYDSKRKQSNKTQDKRKDSVQTVQVKQMNHNQTKHLLKFSTNNRQQKNMIRNKQRDIRSNSVSN